MQTEKISGILFDLDGVLYVGNQAIEGAIATLSWLRERQIPFRFITNTSTRSAADVAGKLNSMGFTIDADDIFSAVTATREFLLKHGSPSVHLLVRESLKADFAEFPQQQTVPDFVVVGDIGAAWDYQLLNRVFRELMAGARLVAMHMNKYWQTEQGLQMDIGAFVAGLEFVSGQQSTVIGKPSKDFFHLATESMGLDPEQVLVVGDDIENDIGGAQAAGLQGALVKTGKYRDILVKKSEITPNAIIQSIANLPTLLGD
ncbi:MAG: TIGR01458 family HAD-type hydrolase [Gammaproteobacteria bacterium]|nr:TIGR01458 family HAD-type hydrolase [Gammaproteobacteria bacterium]